MSTKIYHVLIKYAWDNRTNLLPIEAETPKEAWQKADDILKKSTTDFHTANPVYLNGEIVWRHSNDN